MHSRVQHGVAHCRQMRQCQRLSSTAHQQISKDGPIGVAGARGKVRKKARLQHAAAGPTSTWQLWMSKSRSAYCGISG